MDKFFPGNMIPKSIRFSFWQDYLIALYGFHQDKEQVSISALMKKTKFNDFSYLHKVHKLLIRAGMIRTIEGDIHNKKILLFTPLGLQIAEGLHRSEQAYRILTAANRKRKEG
jgi:hypothetical protein